MAVVPVPVVYPLAEMVPYCALCRDLTGSAETVRWCQALKLLSSTRTCSCGRGMHPVQRKGCPEGMAWRCPRKGRSHLYERDPFLKVINSGYS